jgi:membrane-associated protease RseP (regulator of RpoE activity)
MDLEAVKSIIGQVMTISKWEIASDHLLFTGKLHGAPETTMTKLKEMLQPFNLVPFLSKYENDVVLRIVRLRKRTRTRGPAIHIVLFVLTVVSTLVAGAMYAGGNPIANVSDLLKGIPFSTSILLILGSHELGHYFTSRRRGVDASLPYFIPFPTIIGTMGAVIKQRSFIPDRRTLVRIGAAGPLTGLAFAIPICVLGLRLSTVISLSEIESGSFFSLGESILFYLLAKFSAAVPEGSTLILHPVAFAGWVGILVTGMNLLPFGQLDGGHVAYAILGPRHKWTGIGVLLTLAVLGLLFPGWWVWGVLLFMIVRLGHHPPLDDVTPLGATEKLLGGLCLVAFILTFIPIPFR